MFDKLTAELAASQRLRLGLALIVAVLWLYGALLLRDARDERTRAFRTVSVQLARLEQVEQQTAWPERLEEAKILQTALESALWRGDSLGLSRAAFQDALAQHMKQAGVLRPVITLALQEEDAAPAPGGPDAPEGLEADAAAELASGLWKVKAKLGFDFAPDSLNALLLRLSAPSPRLGIESLRVQREPVPRVEMVVVAYFQKPLAALAQERP